MLKRVNIKCTVINNQNVNLFHVFQWVYARGRRMLKLLDIPDSWFATFMFKRSLDVAANKMSQQAYMQGKLL